MPASTGVGLSCLRSRRVHRRASHWYAQADLPGEAIQHALAAADYALAVQLIEAHGTDMLLQWCGKTVEGWLRTLPQEWSRNSPRANLAFAWMQLLWHGNFERALLYVARLQEIFVTTQIEDAALQAEWLALQATWLCWHCNTASCTSRSIWPRQLSNGWNDPDRRRSPPSVKRSLHGRSSSVRVRRP